MSITITATIACDLPTCSQIRISALQNADIDAAWNRAIDAGWDCYTDMTGEEHTYCSRTHRLDHENAKDRWSAIRIEASA